MEKSTAMQSTLTGFTQELGFRVFAFERVRSDRTRTTCTVRADLTLVRRYGIQIQELPLLCQTVLDRRGEGEETQSFTFTEEEMCACANERAAARAEAAKKKKPAHKPSGENLGSAWRTQQT